MATAVRGIRDVCDSCSQHCLDALLGSDREAKIKRRRAPVLVSCPLDCTLELPAHLPTFTMVPLCSCMNRSLEQTILEQDGMSALLMRVTEAQVPRRPRAVLPETQHSQRQFDRSTCGESDRIG